MLQNPNSTDTFHKHVQRVHGVRWVAYRSDLEKACKTFIASQVAIRHQARPAPTEKAASTVGRSAPGDKSPAQMSSIAAGKRRSRAGASPSPPVDHGKRARKDPESPEERGRSCSTSDDDLYRSPTPPRAAKGSRARERPPPAGNVRVSPGAITPTGPAVSSAGVQLRNTPSTGPRAGGTASSEQHRHGHASHANQPRSSANMASPHAVGASHGIPAPVRPLSQHLSSRGSSPDLIPLYQAPLTGNRRTTPGRGGASPAGSDRHNNGKERSSSIESNDSLGTQWVKKLAEINAGCSQSMQTRGRTRHRGSHSGASPSPGGTWSPGTRAAIKELAEMASRSPSSSSSSSSAQSRGRQPMSAGPSSGAPQASGSRPRQPSESRPVSTTSPSQSPSRPPASSTNGSRR